MKKRHSLLLNLLSCLFILSMAFSTNVHAANALASVTKNSVSKDEVFQLRIIVDQHLSASDVDFSRLEDSFYIGRPSFGSSSSSYNGKRSVRSEWTVALAPLKVGSITIPSFEVAGATTQPITIQVTADANTPTQDDLVEFQTTLENNELYPSQSTHLQVRLIIKADPRQLQNPTILPPSITGVALEPIGESKQYQDVQSGAEVTVVDQRFLLTAEKAGNFTVVGPKLTGAMVYGARNSGTRLLQLDTTPEELSLTVLPIPSDYDGFWLPTSQLTLQQSWQDQDGNPIDEDAVFATEVGESVTRTVMLKAQNLTQHQLPNLSLKNPVSVREYAEKPQFSTTENGTSIMLLKQVLIPTQEGEISLPAITIPWWNTQTKAPQQSRLNGLVLEVKPGDPVVTAMPLAASSAQAPQIIEVKDSGLWPYIALMTSLWAIVVSLIALYLWRRTSSTADLSHSQTAGTQQTSDEQNNLIAIIKQQDPIQTQNHVMSWLTKQTLPAPLREKIEMELKQMNQAHYAQQEQAKDWSEEALITLIKEAFMQAKNKSSDGLILPAL
ncbi:hypothetical protein BCU68_04005 [Vibrio sp. 10N.286.49.B3]|uniref:BatD family protein n=1 Tax=Vibrio sp. 10N.286.49.B3 TaxID=1880855 RepID=UPI000C85259B|nr:BatD family protein [Vibrio sp. 10N.286.49.B3]PMH43160.1 hypothetical protein BCU68_04005 [Vibrio sp. 10N.286.49.B3]